MEPMSIFFIGVFMGFLVGIIASYLAVCGG